MKFKFDPNQKHQLDVISAIKDLFIGQEPNSYKTFGEAKGEIGELPELSVLTGGYKVHNGYFSKDKKGIYKDTKGSTKEDEDTYSLIMKDKEKLLDITNPLKFIFSHSALREGWDNPNIFQICTLNRVDFAVFFIDF